MLIKIQEQITHISDNDEINQQNYMDSLAFISSLYSFASRLKTVLPLEKAEFLPTFFGKNALLMINSEKYDKESEMKVFKVKSSLFLVDATAKKVKSKFVDICEDITQDSDVMAFVLK